MHRPGATCLALLAGPVLMAQYGAGIGGSSWEGIWGVNTQPASLLLHDDRLEINVLRFGFDVHNSYFELERAELGLFGFGRRIEVNTDEAAIQELGNTDRALAFDMRILGPSFAYRLNPRSVVGFTTGLRGAFAALDLDRLARKFGVDTLTIANGSSRRVEEASMRGGALSWAEFGPTYGRTMDLGRRSRLHAAASGKYLMGFFGATVDLRPSLLTGVNDSVQAITDVDLTYTLALPDEDRFNVGPASWVTGSGWNADAGFIVEFLRATGDTTEHWLRVGAAVADIGRIRFDRNASAHEIQNGSTTLEDLNAMRVQHAGQVDSALSALLLGDEHASLIARSFQVRLPMAIHASVDFSPWSHWALRAEVVHGPRKPPNGLAVRDQLAIVPRFETRMVCVAMPFTIDRFRNYGIGLSRRVGGFMIGSDRVGGLFGLNDVAGADIYFGAKVRLRRKS